MNTNKPQNRLIGTLPKIGIRPTIDGRYHGVRESLEETTMGMANNVAAFLSNNLRHANGLPVECVVADTCIGGVKEAAETAAKFAREGVGVSITSSSQPCSGNCADFSSAAATTRRPAAWAAGGTDPDAANARAPSAIAWRSSVPNRLHRVAMAPRRHRSPIRLTTNFLRAATRAATSASSCSDSCCQTTEAFTCVESSVADMSVLPGGPCGSPLAQAEGAMAAWPAPRGRGSGKSIAASARLGRSRSWRRGRAHRYCAGAKRHRGVRATVACHPHTAVSRRGELVGRTG